MFVYVLCPRVVTWRSKLCASSFLCEAMHERSLRPLLSGWLTSLCLMRPPPRESRVMRRAPAIAEI
eukprot:24857-Eustigmatos_ZCMA.PRE.1